MLKLECVHSRVVDAWDNIKNVCGFLHFSWFRVGGLVQTGSCAVGPLSVVSRNSGFPQSFTAAAAPIYSKQLGMLGEPE